jgi:hypothetical protein
MFYYHHFYIIYYLKFHYLINNLINIYLFFLKFKWQRSKIQKLHLNQLERLDQNLLKNKNNKSNRHLIYLILMELVLF